MWVTVATSNGVRIQSSSPLQIENEEFERAVVLLTSFIIWKQMFAVVYSGG